jgi:aquaporin Z
MPKFNVKYLSEFLGTFALVFVGAGAVIVDGHTGTSHGLAEAGKLGLLGIAIAHGLALAGMIYGVGSISGGHFNPAITLAMWIRKRLGADLVFGYMAAQLVGALVASLVLAMIFPDEVGLAQLGTPALGPRISSLQGFAIEAAITFLLTVVVLTSSRSNNSAFAGLAIGGTLTGLILFAGPLTGAAANPARYLGPAIVSRNLDDIWLYLTAPLFGATLAAYVIGFLVDRPDPDAEGHDEDESPEPEGTTGGLASQFASEPASEAPRVALKTDTIKTEAPKLERSESESESVSSDAFKRARELYWGGEGEKAAAALVPLLASASHEGRELDDDVRSLLMVIEDSCGPLKVFDRYRDILARPAHAGAPSPLQPEARADTH